MRLQLALVAAGVAVTSLMMPTSSTSAVAPPNLILHYTFDGDTTTTIADSSMSALSGALVNADPATAFVSGAPGKRKGLSLVASERQFVDVPQSDTLDVNTYTLSAWIRYSGNQTADTLGRWEVLEKAGAYWLNVRTNGRVRAGGFYGGCANGQYWKYFDSSRTVASNVWTHLAATYNGSRLVIYINGQTSGSLAVTGTTCANDEPLAVGAKNAPAKGLLEAFWDGTLDDVRVYTKALSASRIATIAGLTVQ